MVRGWQAAVLGLDLQVNSLSGFGFWCRGTMIRRSTIRSICTGLKLRCMGLAACYRLQKIRYKALLQSKNDLSDSRTQFLAQKLAHLEKSRFRV